MTLMKKLTVLSGLMAISMASASAETLRVGLQDDPDTMDPATGGTYSGRIVFDALCDKLLDINREARDRAAAGDRVVVGRQQHRADAEAARRRDLP